MSRVTANDIGRDPDGDAALDFHAGDDTVSISISANGGIAWAARVGGKSSHGTIRGDPLGPLLFAVIGKMESFVGPPGQETGD